MSIVSQFPRISFRILRNSWDFETGDQNIQDNFEKHPEMMKEHLRTHFCVFLDLFDFVPQFFHDFRRFLAFIADGHGGSPDFALGRISLQADVR